METQSSNMFVYLQVKVRVRQLFRHLVKETGHSGRQPLFKCYSPLPSTSLLRGGGDRESNNTPFFSQPGREEMMSQLQHPVGDREPSFWWWGDHAPPAPPPTEVGPDRLGLAWREKEMRQDGRWRSLSGKCIVYLCSWGRSSGESLMAWEPKAKTASHTFCMQKIAALINRKFRKFWTTKFCVRARRTHGRLSVWSLWREKKEAEREKVAGNGGRDVMDGLCHSG